MTLQSLIQVVIKEQGISYTQYRFDKASNFYTFEAYIHMKAMAGLIDMGKEAARVKKFEEKTSEELKIMKEVWHSDQNQALVRSITLEQANAQYYKNEGIDASYELERRDREEVRKKYA